jgi:branched-chain amino acid transport system substrate-binding protein
MKRIWMVALAALTLAGVATAQEARNFYKVGVITSLSGELATGGNVTKRGYDLWANEVNAKGGIEIGGKKYKVELAYADDQSQPAQAASAAERLATQEKVDFVLGPYASGTTRAAAPVLEKYKIPMITGSAESPLIWLDKLKYTFGTIPPVNYTGSGPIITLGGLTPKIQTAFILGSDDTFSKSTAEAFKAAAEQAKMKVVNYQIVPAGQDLIPLLNKAKAMKPDLIAFGGHDKELINIVKGLRQINYTPKALLMHYGVTEPAFVEALGKDAQDVFGASVWTETIKTKGDILWKDAASYGKAAMDAFGVPADYTQAGCTAAGIAFQAALQKIKAVPPLSDAKKDELLTALEGLDIQTFYGRIKFAKEGQFYHSNVGLTPLTVQIQGGKTAVVGPKDLAQSPVGYPLKAWAKR